MDVTLYYVIAGVVYVFSLLVKRKLLATYAKWGRVRSASGLRGEQVARDILDNNQLQSVSVAPVPGDLSDHYDPRSKSISLSATNFAGESVAATAVSAHECGHAIQDATGYLPMKLRSAAMPIANAAARFGIPAAIVGSVIGLNIVVQLGVLAYVGSILITFLVLPVEFNASKRALQQLEELHLVSPGGQDGAKHVLRAAAMTYVAGVASSAGYLLFVLVSAGRSLFGRAKVP